MCVNNDVKIASFFSAEIVKPQLYSYVKFMKWDKEEKFNFWKITTVWRDDEKEFFIKLFISWLFKYFFIKKYF